MTATCAPGRKLDSKKSMRNGWRCDLKCSVTCGMVRIVLAVDKW
jgi:hypothetical protein